MGVGNNIQVYFDELPTMVQIVVVLLRQRDDQHEIGLPWMDVHI